MSKSSIRFFLLAISCFAVVYGLELYGEAIRPANRVTEVDKLEQHNRVQDEIYQHLSSLQRNYMWSDTSRTDANGYDTIYLPFKFVDQNYFVSTTTSSVTMYASVIMSDSSFLVLIYGYGGSPSPATAYRYIAIGMTQ